MREIRKRWITIWATASDSTFNITIYINRLSPPLNHNRRSEQVTATLAALGLEVITTSSTFYIVAVLDLFEEQWVAALADLGITASVDSISSTT